MLNRNSNKQLRINILTILALVFISSSLAVAASPQLLFEAGNRAYLDGDWFGALEKWREVEASGWYNGELYYNMGNAAFKLNQLGFSIFYWEKAARFLGEDKDIQTNLKIARSRITDKIDEEVRLPVWDWFDNFRAMFSIPFLAWSSVLIMFMLFIIISIRRWIFRLHPASRPLKIASYIVLVVLLFDLSMLTLKAMDDANNLYGILLAQETEVLSAPAAGTGKLLFTLHEGTRVRVLRQIDRWYEISAGKDRQGWAKRESMGII